MILTMNKAPSGMVPTTKPLSILIELFTGTKNSRLCSLRALEELNIHKTIQHKMKPTLEMKSKFQI